MAQEKEKKFYLHTNNMLTLKEIADKLKGQELFPESLERARDFFSKLERDKTKEHITLCDGFYIVTFWFEGSKTINPGWMHKVIDNEK